MVEHTDEVTWITTNIAITNYYSAHCKETLAICQVRAVLCLDRDLAGNTAENRGIECIRVVHMVDGANEMFVLGEAVTALDELVHEYNRVVVHCRAGRSRSVAVVAAYLVKTQNMDTDAALDLVASKRPAAISPELVNLVGLFDVQ